MAINLILIIILKGACKELVGYTRYKYRILREKLTKTKTNVK